MIKELKNLRFKVGIAFLPLLPFISDTQEKMEEMAKIAKELNVDYVFFGDLTLYGAGKQLFFNVLKNHFPELVEKYKELYKDSCLEKEYKNRFYNNAKRICKKFGVKWGIL